jgi:hypothetical protein
MDDPTTLRRNAAQCLLRIKRADTSLTKVPKGFRGRFSHGRRYERDAEFERPSDTAKPPKKSCSSHNVPAPPRSGSSYSTSLIVTIGRPCTMTPPTDISVAGPAYLCQPSPYPREGRALDDATTYSTRSVPETGVALIASCLIYQVRKSQLKQRR